VKKEFLGDIFPRSSQTSWESYISIEKFDKNFSFTKEIIIDISFSRLYARLVGLGMIMCLGCRNDVSIVTISVVVLIIDHT
jgi:hypothetical protein